MRILMINKFLYPRAGAETYMIGIAEGLVARGHEVAFFGMEHPENTTVGRTYTVPFLEYGTRQGLGGLAKNLARGVASSLTGATAKAYRACVAEFKPDLVHAHNVYNQLPPDLPLAAHDLPGKPAPVLMTVHDYKPVCPNYSLFTEGAVCTRCLDGDFSHCVTHRCAHGSLVKSWIAAKSQRRHAAQQTYRRAYQHYVAPSRFMRDRLVDGGFTPDSITVIHNYAVLPPPPADAGQNLLYAGRLCVEKGVDTLLHAYADLPEPRPSLKILGEGPLGDELRQLAKDRGLNALTWLGRVPQAEVAATMRDSGAVIVPSRWHENCSMVIMETLAAGRAVICSDAGGNPELVKSGEDGEVFPADDTAALGRILARLAADPGRLVAMGQAARRSAEARFTRDIHLQQLLQVYDKLLALDAETTLET